MKKGASCVALWCRAFSQRERDGLVVRHSWAFLKLHTREKEEGGGKGVGRAQKRGDETKKECLRRSEDLENVK